MQENRSFDHCFGTLQGVRGFNNPRAIPLPDGRPVFLQTNDKGETYGPFRLDIKDTKITWMGSLPHSRASQVDAFNEGKYDKWLTAKKSGNKKYADMPLTMGYYTREDLPFNYAMADAFTICDHNFCSAMTSTTPNRSFFWTGKITREENGIPKANIRNDDFSFGKFDWKTFPQLLQENKVAWKFYQNEVSCGGGFEGEERAWLGNFGCNNLEFFAAHLVKFTPKYISSLQKQLDTLPAQITQLQEASPSSEEEAAKNKAAVAKKQEVLDKATAEMAEWNAVQFGKLSAEQKELYQRAFVVNAGDPDYRKLTKLSYIDGAETREVTVPAGDLLHQFRKDVQEGNLPAVSWLAGPQNVSDHPSAPWYGAWYVSEILDILTGNPDVWKKTIFIVTYDENDGYYDHLPPFSIPDNNKPGTGKVSAGIETEIEHIRLADELKQGVPAKQAREAPIGLGFRVPMIIASPWSRGGKVCSEVFDHTSTLQFLEVFFSHKLKKKIEIENISRWRRTICGDLTSVFSPFDGGAPGKIRFLKRDKTVEDIYSAKFKEIPSISPLSDHAIKRAMENPVAHSVAEQEKGTRIACALPYELYVNGAVCDKKQLEISMTAANAVFGSRAAGAPFTVIAPGVYNDEAGTAVARNWSFAVVPGDTLTYRWPLEAFEGSRYHILLNGVNGFFRSFKGSAADPDISIAVNYEKKGIPSKQLTGNVVVSIQHTNITQPVKLIVNDNAYKKNAVIRQLTAAAGTTEITLSLKDSSGWYDFSVTVEGHTGFEQRFAGRVETGKESITDPFMGRV
jgi:phospholipase C